MLEHVLWRDDIDIISGIFYFASVLLFGIAKVVSKPWEAQKWVRKQVLPLYLPHGAFPTQHKPKPSAGLGGCNSHLSPREHAVHISFAAAAHYNHFFSGPVMLRRDEVHAKGSDAWKKISPRDLLQIVATKD